MSTSEVAITAPLTSLMATEAAAWESVCSSPMWRWMFSDDDDRVVHHQSRRQYDSEQGQGVDGEPGKLDEGKRPHQRYRNRHRGNQRAAPFLQEDQHHQHDEEDRFQQRLQDFVYGVAHKRRGIECDLVLQPGRKPR